MRRIVHAALAGVSLGALATPAFAQTEPTEQSVAEQAAEEGVSADDIVVVGTLIRGTEAVGSQTISVDQTTITEAGKGTTNELLGTIPQLVGQFNGRFEIDPRGFGTGTNSINKPNLRNLAAAGSGSTTLVLMNGMRMTPVGVNDAAIDVDLIPSNVLAGIDAVTDGGSSLYGADAVGGVLNFRTQRKYEGVKLDANFGFGTTVTSYKAWDVAGMAGTSWSSGNAYVSVSHYERTRVANGDVPWSSGRVYSAANPDVGAFASSQCINPVGTEFRWLKFGAGASSWTNNLLAPGVGLAPVGTPCDQVASETYSPEMKRTNVFASVTQEFSDAVSLNVTGYWAKRDMYFKGYPVGATALSSSPFVIAGGQPGAATGAQFGAVYGDQPAGTLLGVPAGTGYSLGANAAYVNRGSAVGFETWGITPELTVRLGGDWQTRVGMHYGRSTNYNRFPSLNTVLASCYINGCTGIAAGQLNPLNVAAASASVINALADFETANDTKHEMFLARAIVDGPLFALPGGDVKVALGVEYQRNAVDFRTALGTVNSIDSLPFVHNARNAKSAFGELHIPVTSFLDIAASGRYDSYSDFGNTFNPSIGATLKPTNWLKIFGHWNTSYNAPTPLDALGIGSGRPVCSPYSVNGTPGTSARPFDPLGVDTYASGTTYAGQRLGTCALVLTGGRPQGLEPQTAESWAVGFDASPAPWLNFGVTYYSIDFENVIGALNPSNTFTYTTNPDLYIYNPEIYAAGGSTDAGAQAAYQAILAELANGAAVLAAMPSFKDAALIVDSRTSNLNAAKIQGIDFHLNVDVETGIGRIGWGVNGNVPTKILISSPGATSNELGRGLNPEYTASTWLSWRKDRWSVKTTVNITGPFIDRAADYLGKEVRVHPYPITNLFIGYKIEPGDGPLGGTSFRLNVDNLFDRQPQRIKRSSTNFPSFANWTLGRVIKFGITKEFGGRSYEAAPPPPPMAPPPPAPVEVAPPPPPAPEPVAPPPPPAPLPGERG